MSKKILLVEDEALIAMHDAAMLTKSGYEVITAYNAQKALATVLKEDIDLVLMDIDLGRGKMDGTEAAEIILEEKDVPIVFLSSHTEPEVVEKTEGITSYGYIVKDSGETVLLASLKMAFRLYSAHVELKRQKEHLNTALIKYEQTAEELAEKSEELDRYFTSSLDMLCIAGTEGEFIRLNPEWEKVLGYSVSELEGRSFIDFVHEDDREVTLRALIKLEAQEDVTSFENRFRCKDGSYRWIEWRSTPIGTKIYAAARDITERKQAEREIRAKEENLRTTLKSIGDGVISTNAEGQVTWMNPVAESLCGWKEEDAKGIQLEKVFKIINANTRETADNPVEKVMRTGNIVGLANHTVLVSKGGKEYQIADSAAPIRDDSGGINGVVLVFRDVTEQYTKARELQDSEEKYRKMAESVGAVLWEYDITRDRWTYVAPQVESLLGYGPSEWSNFKFWADRIHPEDRNWATDYCNQCTKQGKDHRFEYRFLAKNGDFVWLRDDVTVELSDGIPVKLRGTIVDISNRKQAEAELKSALMEKDFLMKELNHRIKNNLSMVSSLIRLKDEETEEDLSDLVHRIDAISLVHEKLHRHDDIERIEVKEYFQELLQSVFSFTAYKNVQIVNTTEDVSIPVKAAIPLGLIVNEIATNAIKYGFTDEEEARFTVTLREDEVSNRYTLTLSNTGRQFPEEVDVDGAKTLGLQLVSALVVQLQGTLELKRKPHPVFTITFPIESNVA